MTDTSSISTASNTSTTKNLGSEIDQNQLLIKLIEKKNQKKKKKKTYTNSDEESIDKIVQKAFDTIIGKCQYSPLKTSEWMTKMIQKTSNEILKNHRHDDRKFVIHCTICSKTDDLSICSANQCSWDTVNDVVVYSEWTSQTVFGAVYVFFITHRFSK